MVVSHCLSDRSTLMFPAAGGAGQFPGSFGCCAARLSPQRPSHPAWSPWQPAGQVETSELWRCLVIYLTGVFLLNKSIFMPFNFPLNVLFVRLTAASNKLERRFRSKKSRVRADHSSSVGFYHQPSVMATLTSGHSLELFKCLILNLLLVHLKDIKPVFSTVCLQESSSQHYGPDPAVPSLLTVRKTDVFIFRCGL